MPNLGINTHSAPRLEPIVMCRATITDFDNQKVKITMGGNDGKTSYIDWGDGDRIACSHNRIDKEYEHTYSANGEYAVRITDDLEQIELFHIEDQEHFGVKIETLKWLTNVESLNIQLSPSRGDITLGLQSLCSLESLYMKQTYPNTAIEGSLFLMRNLQALRIIEIDGIVNLIGLLRDIGSLPGLSELSFANTLIGGNIGDLRKLPLTRLDLSNTNVASYTTGELSWGAVEADFSNLRELGAEAISHILQDVNALANRGGSLDFSGCGVAYDDLDALGRIAHSNLIGRDWEIVLDT